jgi:hypothetical protein
MTPPYRPKPIRYDLNTWLVMRNDPVCPKAIVRRVHHRDGHDRYLVIKWDLDPAKCQLMSVVDSLDRADDLVRYDVQPPDDVHSGPPNGLTADGKRWMRPGATQNKSTTG